jgi:hypothetical protein
MCRRSSPSAAIFDIVLSMHSTVLTKDDNLPRPLAAYNEQEAWSFVFWVGGKSRSDEEMVASNGSAQRLTTECLIGRRMEDGGLYV